MARSLQPHEQGLIWHLGAHGVQPGWYLSDRTQKLTQTF
jgi:hypothetical protein